MFGAERDVCVDLDDYRGWSSSAARPDMETPLRPAHLVPALGPLTRLRANP